MTSKENMLEVLRHGRPERVPDGLENLIPEINLDMVEWPESPGKDIWGVTWDLGLEESGAYPVGHPLDSFDDLDSYPFPEDLPSAPYTSYGKELFSSQNRGDLLIMGRVGETLFERAWMMLGMEGFFAAIYENPEGLKRLIGRIAQIRSRMVDRHIESGCDAIMFADDYGGQGNLLINPDSWREFIAPHLAEMYAKCKAAEKLVFQHSCGHIEPILPDLVEMGLDVWHPCQPASNDLAKIKKLFGDKLVFYGAIDSTILAMGTPDEVRDEVRLRIKQLAPGGGYIAGPSHGVPFSQANIEAMHDQIRRSGRYGANGKLIM